MEPTEGELAQWKTLVSTGLTLGGLHVLTPDHLSALSALSVGSSWRAFALGVRWGAGHSSGLLLVTAVFIYLKGDLDLKQFGRFCDALVGVFMMIIGCYGAFGAIKFAREKKKLKEDYSEEYASSSSDGVNSLTKAINDLCDKKEATADTSVQMVGTLGKRNTGKNAIPKEDSSSSVALLVNQQQGWNSTSQSHAVGAEGSDSHHLQHHHSLLAEDCKWCPFIDMRDPFTQRVVSFAIGLLHGVAGPGGVLAVFPTVQMTSWKSASLYLGSFIIASTFSMGVFASVYGETTRRLGASAESVELGLRVFSSCMSVLVGAVWLTLSILGKLAPSHTHNLI